MKPPARLRCVRHLRLCGRPAGRRDCACYCVLLRAAVGCCVLLRGSACCAAPAAPALSAGALSYMLSYARETKHEKIVRGLGLGLAFIVYGQEKVRRRRRCLAGLAGLARLPGRR